MQFSHITMTSQDAKVSGAFYTFNLLGEYINVLPTITFHEKSNI